ncbi:MAG: hypothetical protein ACIPMY_01330 [Rickettsia endosymbiont of Pentastiridius leporinus]
MSDKDNLRENISHNLKARLERELEERGLTPYKLAEATQTNETLWKSVREGRTKLPSLEAIVCFADYIKAPLDEVVGRNLAKERELKASRIITKTETKLPAFIAGLSPEALQSINRIKKSAPSLVLNEDAAKYKGPVQKKSFVEQEQARRSNKSTKKSR